MSGARPAPVEIRSRVVGVDPVVDHGPLLVEVAPRATVADLFAAVAAHDPDGAERFGGLEPLELRWNGRRAAPGSDLAAVDVAAGGRIDLVWTRPGADAGPPADRSEPVSTAWRPGPVSVGTAQHPPLLSDGVWRVGRDPLANDVVLDHPSVSRHHAVLEVDGGALVVHDRNSTNGTSVDGADVESPVVLHAAARIAFGDVGMEFTRIDGLAETVRRPIGDATPAPVLRHDAGPPVFGVRTALRRAPRIERRVPTVVVSAPRPPGAPPKARIPWITGLAPLVLGFGTIVVSRLALGGGAAVWASAAFLLLSPLLVFAGWAESRRHRRLDLAEAHARFDRRLAEATAEAARALAGEAALLDDLHPGTDELLRWPRARHQRLWERARDPGPPALRIGSGPVPSQVVIEDAGGADVEIDDDLAMRRSRLVEGCSAHAAAPRTIDLVGHRVVSLVAAAETSVALARSLVVQAHTLLPPSRVETIVFTDDVASWHGLAWLRDVGRPRWSNTVVADPTERARVLDELAAHPAPEEVLRLVIVVEGALEGAELDRLAASIESGGGERLLWCGARRENGPTIATVVVDAGAPDASAVEPRTGEVHPLVSTEAVDADRFEAWARDLCALDEAAPVGPLTGRSSGEGLEELLELAPSSSTVVIERWANPCDGLATPVGTDPETGERVSVDLVADGPHALVAGTTGAGKSELLRACIASMAATHPPTRVTFLFVDFKGGSAFGDLTRLPHSVGLVTDLDGHLVDRVLRSLSAEVRRRERILRDAGAPDLAEHARRHPDRPLPRLVIVVDEFAAILEEVPGFLDGMIDLARRGRSLGLHLILATQRPGGVVTEHLRANVNLRIALRVTDATESIDVIGVPDAVSIGHTTPGRAIVRVGNREPFPLQAPWTRRRRHDGGCGVPVRCRTLSAVTSPRSAGTASADGPTDLERLVERLRRAARDSAAPPPHRPWLEPVSADVGALEVLSARNGATDRLAGVVGVADDPDRQRQWVATLPLDGTATVVVCSELDSAWAAAELVVLGASRDVSPHALRVDVIDGSGRRATRLEALPHVGSVVAADDHERIGRLLDDLRAVSTGTGAGAEVHARRPHRLVVVHHLGVVLDAAGTRRATVLTGTLERIIVDGPDLGVTVVLTADRRRAVPHELFGAVTHRLVMRLADPAEYSTLDPGAEEVASAGPRIGRLDGVTVQVPRALESDEFERFAARCRRRWDVSHPPVAVLPATVDAAAVAAVVDGPAGTWRWPVGIEDRMLGAAWIDLSEDHLLVVGGTRSGRAEVLAMLARAARTAPDAPLTVGVGIGTGNVERFDVVVEADGGLDALIAGAPWASGRPTLVLIAEPHDGDASVLERIETLLGIGRRHPVRVVVSASSAAVRSAWDPATSQLRTGRHLLVVNPDPAVDEDVAGVSLVHGERYTPRGRAEHVHRSRSTLVALALPEPA